MGMTMQERNEIFAKDYLTIDDVGKLQSTTYGVAARIIRNIKSELTMSDKYNKQGIRPSPRGKIHVQDYLDYYRLPRESIYGAQAQTENAV
jgi:hypothetical protein